MPHVKHLVHMDSKDGRLGNHAGYSDSAESSPRSRISFKTAFQVVESTKRFERSKTGNVNNASARSSIFANFETCRLSTEERLFLHAARLGEVAVLNNLLLGEQSPKMNVNCVDYMGRNALFLAVDSECVEAIEFLMDHISWECMEEALLHAIAMGSHDIVRIMVDHPSYIIGEKQSRQAGYTDPFFRTEEKYQFSPDITPLILAAHKNDHELIQLFLSQGCSISKPHAIDCQCDNCLVKQTTDSLKRSRSRVNAYRALASPAFMALSYADPITATFELRQEMKKVAHVEKEFQGEYLALVEQCMDFACQLMDLCRGTQEVEAVLGEDLAVDADPLARLRLALEYDEKKFVAHPNCQQHLTNIWYGKDMGFFQTLPLLKKVCIIMLAAPLMPVICLSYIVYPHTSLARKLKCPISKFITHTVSHFFFLFLLGLATFSPEAVFYSAADQPDFVSVSYAEVEKIRGKFRPMNSTISLVQYIIMFWIIGLLWIECKQIYGSGAREHFMQHYNFMDFSILALYIASYSLRIVAHKWVVTADRFFNATGRVTEAINTQNMTIVQQLLDDANSLDNHPYGYFIHASRFRWSPRDPEIVSDILFAIANVMSFARTTYVMPSHEMLGPLQISLGRMFGDIARFIVLFILVLVAFMVGMTNLYRYYGSHFSEVTQQAASQTFKGLPETLNTLFFSIFGLIALDKLKITPHDEVLSGLHLPATGVLRISRSVSRVANRSTESLNYAKNSTVLVDQVGMILFAIYLVVVTIVLVNILIAMMSHSFEDVQEDNDVEWKFARTKLWLNYIDEDSTMPVPFNMIPKPMTVWQALLNLRQLANQTFAFKEDLGKVNYNFKKRRANVYTPDPEAMKSLLLNRSSTYTEIIQRLVRRYLFKLERDKKEAEVERVLVTAEGYDEENEKSADAADDTSSKASLNPICETEKEDDAFNKQDDTHSICLDVPPLSPSIISGRKRASSATMVSFSDVPSGGQEGIQRSRSAEAMRQLTRRATIKRSGTKRGSALRKHSAPPDPQLEAIQRGQRVLELRLQDLQTTHVEEEYIRENITHMRHVLCEHQKAISSMVRAMDTMQTEIRSLVGHVTSPKPLRAASKKGLSKGLRLSFKKNKPDPTDV